MTGPRTRKAAKLSKRHALSNAATAKPPDATPLGQFGRFPAEIRNIIYKMVLVQVTTSDKKSKIWPKRHRRLRSNIWYMPGLLAASKVIRQETLVIYFDAHMITFHTRLLEDVVKFVLCCLRTVVISFTEMSLEHSLSRVSFQINYRRAHGRTFDGVYSAAQIHRLCYKHGFNGSVKTARCWVLAMSATFSLLPAHELGHQAYLHIWTDGQLSNQASACIKAATTTRLTYWDGNHGLSRHRIAYSLSSRNTSVCVDLLSAVPWDEQFREGSSITIVDDERMTRVNDLIHFGPVIDSPLSQCHPKLCSDAQCWHLKVQELIDRLRTSGSPATMDLIRQSHPF